MSTQIPPSDKPAGEASKQPPVPVPGKPSDASKQEPGKEPAKTTLPQEKTGELPTTKDDMPQVEVPQPVIPLAPPPGALIPVTAKEPQKGTPIGSIVYTSLWLIGILALGAIIIAWLKKNKDKQLAGISLSPHDQLSAFRDSLDQGDMTDEEFKKVKALLAEKIKLPASKAPAAQAPTPPDADTKGTDHATKQ